VHSKDEIAQALDGRYRPEHLFEHTRAFIYLKMETAEEALTDLKQRCHQDLNELD
jgi:hypothetical protein